MVLDPMILPLSPTSICFIPGLTQQPCRDPNMIWGMFVSQAILGSLGSPSSFRRRLERLDEGTLFGQRPPPGGHPRVFQVEEILNVRVLEFESFMLEVFWILRVIFG